MIAEAALPDGYVLHAFASLGSTNDEARRLAEAGAPGGQVVVAEVQTAGRGRAGRSWTSPPGNLYVSILLRPTRPLAEFGQLSLLASVALGDAIGACAPGALELGLKWPNDVLIRGAKVAGILLESGGVPERDGPWMIIGCGVNVASAPQGVPYPATALAAEGLTITPRQLLDAYVAALERWREVWTRRGFGPVRKVWLKRAVRLGEEVHLRLPKGDLGGRFVDLSPGGALILETSDGARREIAAGDVVFGAAP